jgi:FkbM family methyltransferase
MHENPALFPGQRLFAPLFRTILGPFLGNRIQVIKGGLAKGLKHRGFGLGNPPLNKEERFLQKQDLEDYTVYDVGASEGIYGLFFARSVGPNGTVVAIEPLADSCSRIEDNVALNEFENVQIISTALGKEPGSGELVYPSRRAAAATLHPDFSKALQAGGGTDQMNATITTLDALIADRELPKPDFINIDVNGLEGDVLEGMSDTIAQHQPQVFVEMYGVDEDARLENAKRIVEFLDERSYKIYHVEWDRYAVPTNYDRARDGHIWCTPPGWKRRRRRH